MLQLTPPNSPSTAALVGVGRGESATQHDPMHLCPCSLDVHHSHLHGGHAGREGVNLLSDRHVDQPFGDHWASRLLCLQQCTLTSCRQNPHMCPCIAGAQLAAAAFMSPQVNAVCTRGLCETVLQNCGTSICTAAARKQHQQGQHRVKETQCNHLRFLVV